MHSQSPSVYTFGLEEEYLWTAPKLGLHPPFEQWEQESSKRPFNIGQEAHADVVELISPVVSSLSALSAHLRSSREWLNQQATQRGCSIFAGGTHPTRDWQQESMTDKTYYTQVVNDYQAAMRGNFIFGMHTHLGGVAKHRIPTVFNEMRPLLPLLIALSGNSTHWRGEPTGLACYRLCVFSRMPRTGVPPKMVSVDSWMRNLDERLRAGSLKKVTQIWYDMRYHPVYHTIENRVMDMQPDTDVAVGIALLSLLMLMEVDRAGAMLHDFSSEMPEWVLEENRWRSIRDGLRAELLNDQLQPIPARKLLSELLSRVGPDLRLADERSYIALLRHADLEVTC